MNKKLTIFFASMLFVALQATAQMQITGKVTSAEDGLPIPGVSVVVSDNTTIGTTTNIDGEYSLTVPSNAEVLLFSFVGMKSEEVAINGRSTIDVVMITELLEMDEVIVVAYGTTTKEAFTGSAEVISSKELESRTLTSTIGAIEGTTAGVQIVSASGQPGSSPSIVIRGVGTLNGSTDPLYVVDGVQYEGSIANLNTADIASMTILKDAASTSLYGSRAANGAVIITTKRGKKASEIKVNASANIGVVSAGVPFYKRASAGEYYELIWEAYKNSLIDGGDTPADAAIEASSTVYNRLGYNPFNVANDQIVGTDGTLNPNAQVIAKSLDWYDELEQHGVRQDYNLSLAGGGEKFDAYFSTGYLNEEGYIITSSYERSNTRLNANFDATKWLSIGGNMNLTIANKEGPFSAGSGSIVNPFGFAKGLGSVYPVYIVDPTTGDYILDAAGEKQYDLGGGYPAYGIAGRPYNPDRHGIAEADWNSEERMTNTYSTRYYADFTILPELKFTLNYGIDVNDYLRKRYENEKVGDGAPFGRYRETRYRRTVKNFNQILTYNKRFDSGHNVDITLGHENFDRHYSRMSGMKTTQTAVGIHEFDNFATTTDFGGYSTDKRTEGYFTRLNYNFRDKYYLTGSFRRDGSSVFHKDVRWGNFYSIGGSWRITEENFMKNLTFINSLKLRASYGQVGQDILLDDDDVADYYISQPRYDLFPNAGDPGIYWSALGNTALTWETSSSWDVSLDYRLFNSLLEGSFEYWERNSTDLLYNVPLPLSVGLSSGPDNVASIVNSGFEINITANILRNEDWRWSLTLNASTTNNKITELPEAFVDGSKRWEEGRSRFEFFIYDYAGVDPANGDALYYMYEEIVDPDDGTSTFEPLLDTDGTHRTTNDYGDAGKGYSGKSATPDLMGGIQNTLSYKGFELNFLFTYRIGGYVLDYGYADMMNEGIYGESLHPDLLDGWRAAGDVTDIPRMENGNPNLNQAMSTRYLTDATYFGLRNLGLSYTFQQKFVKDLGIENLKLYVVGENLFYSTARKGLNPQYNLAGTPDGDDYNPARVISAGLNISF